MTARASVYYSCEFRADVLYLEDVRPVGTQTTSVHGTTVGISINSDSLIDNIITALQSVQRERQVQAAQSRVKQFERDSARLQEVLDQADRKAEATREEANDMFEKLQAERHKLAALTTQAWTDAGHRAVEGKD